MNTPEMTKRVDPGLAAGNRIQLASYAAKHFQWHIASGVGRITAIDAREPRRTAR